MAGQTHRQGEGGGYPPGYGQGSPRSRYGRKRPRPSQPPQGPAQGPGHGHSQAPGPGYGPGPAQQPYQPYAAPTGEPEYFGQAGAQGYDDAPGHTRAFTLGEPQALADGAAEGFDGGFGAGTGDGYDNVATYRAGRAAAPPAGPRLHWKQLLSGIVLRPGQTFWQMRDHTVWGPALTVTFVYGLLAVFGFDAARSDVLSATLATSVPWVLTTGVAVVLCAVTLGAVTNTLARQLGGDGAWAPTIGLAMLITSLTDAPRLFFALFLGGGNGFVQLLGWLTWLACATLLTSMVGKSHDLPWLKALGASSIQLVALLMLFKLPLI
ncbi:Yip1 family protein [Streptomyces sp. V4-01]|uniref:Yip1 family protein n=1 Tax=Actinacidiphila polyblastidii TaxID=3110430 RepID=A0ABU7PFD0_9ACTN|nr:Yip1 family protein [Streptomyces sp. V4-01]